MTAISGQNPAATMLELAQQRALAKLPGARIQVVGATIVATESYADLDGNVYELEYVLCHCGMQTRAYCRKMPAFARTEPLSIHQTHLYPDGLICLAGPSMDFDDVVARARFWCNVTTYLFQHGVAETRALVKEW